MRHCRVRSHEKTRASLEGRLVDMTWTEGQIFYRYVESSLSYCCGNMKWFAMWSFSWINYPVSIQSWGLPCPKSKVAFIFDINSFNPATARLAILSRTHFLCLICLLFIEKPHSNKKCVYEKLSLPQLPTHWSRGGFPSDAVTASHHRWQEAKTQNLPQN